jgi:hypothetical protein
MELCYAAAENTIRHSKLMQHHFLLMLKRNCADKVNMIDRRTVKRLLCADLVDVCWCDDAGRRKSEVMVLEDISLSGLCLQSERPHKPGTDVSVKYGDGTLSGVIRYCVYQQIGYFLGVEFTGECKWPTDKFRPRHLLDPEVLLKRVTARAHRHIV